ncbi:uncharacterized protein LOC110062482 [Orbicella faveolata]|uniref:uncharacterized protein LOC110062482 n=1 Tax=Orbicella faveolata TaxID=48498 RepID=UPI0009E2154C|nr:uncharacterized protein LOC110062482 [Orbicella faveolata]
MTEKMIVVVLRCFVFCICLISVVPAFKECKKIDQCSCSTDEGIISLWKLAGTDKPRFSHIPCTGFSYCTASWNPCRAYTDSWASRICHNVSACAFFGNLHRAHHPIAYQSTATCELSDYGLCVLKYTGEEAPSGYSTSLTVKLICNRGSGEGTITGMDATNSSGHFTTALLSKYACPIPPPPTEGSRQALAFSLLIAYEQIK